MELTGETLIAAPRALVWAALNDPDVLARCIEGVETLTRIGDDRFEGKMNAKVGPVRATFTGGVTLTEIEAPRRYVLVGEGKGGIAGFAKGSAVVVLSDVVSDDAEATKLTYVVSSTVGGKLAQLGARLIEGTAKGYAESFFARLRDELETANGHNARAGLPDTAIATQQKGRASLAPLIWSSALILMVILLLVWQLK
jgi:hypothetical protein